MILIYVFHIILMDRFVFECISFESTIKYISNDVSWKHITESEKLYTYLFVSEAFKAILTFIKFELFILSLSFLGLLRNS